jgi:hypothetical protein
MLSFQITITARLPPIVTLLFASMKPEYGNCSDSHRSLVVPSAMSRREVESAHQTKTFGSVSLQGVSSL